MDEAVGGLVAAVVGEDRGQHRDAEHAAELADRVVGARCLTFFLGLDRGEDDVGDGREVHRHPDAGEREGNDDARVGQRRRQDGSDPGEAGCLECEAGGHDRAAADPVGEQPGDRGDQDRHRRPGQDAKARLKRRGALHGLEVLGEQEDRAEHPDEHEQRGDVGRGEGAVAEEAHRQHRRRCAELPEDEQCEDGRAGEQSGDDLDRRPAGVVAANETPHDRQQAGGREGEAGQVEPAVRAVRLLELAAARAGSARARTER